MNTPQGNKILPLKVGTAATNATASLTIDRLGYEYANVIVSTGVASATDSADKWVSLVLKEGDTSAVSSASNIAAFVGSTASSVTSGFVLPTHNDTASPSCISLHVDCRARKRYLFLVTQPDPNQATYAVTAILSKGKVAADTTTEQGVNCFVSG